MTISMANRVNNLVNAKNLKTFLPLYLDAMRLYRDELSIEKREKYDTLLSNTQKASSENKKIINYFLNLMHVHTILLTIQDNIKQVKKEKETEDQLKTYFFDELSSLAGTSQISLIIKNKTLNIHRFISTATRNLNRLAIKIRNEIERHYGANNLKMFSKDNQQDISTIKAIVNGIFTELLHKEFSYFTVNTNKKTTPSTSDASKKLWRKLTKLHQGLDTIDMKDNKRDQTILQIQYLSTILDSLLKGKSTPGEWLRDQYRIKHIKQAVLNKLSEKFIKKINGWLKKDASVKHKHLTPKSSFRSPKKNLPSTRKNEFKHLTPGNPIIQVCLQMVCNQKMRLYDKDSSTFLYFYPLLQALDNQSNTSDQLITNSLQTAHPLSSSDRLIDPLKKIYPALLTNKKTKSNTQHNARISQVEPLLAHLLTLEKQIHGFNALRNTPLSKKISANDLNSLATGLRDQRKISINQFIKLNDSEAIAPLFETLQAQHAYCCIMLSKLLYSKTNMKQPLSWLDPKKAKPAVGKAIYESACAPLRVNKSTDQRSVIPFTETLEKIIRKIQPSDDQSRKKTKGATTTQPTNQTPGKKPFSSQHFKIDPKELSAAIRRMKKTPKSLKEPTTHCSSPTTSFK
jgi:hypothetical protein